MIRQFGWVISGFWRNMSTLKKTVPVLSVRFKYENQIKMLEIALQQAREEAFQMGFEEEKIPVAVKPKQPMPLN
jgi:hypothetical protein